jgi:hypothetical protein
VKQRIPRHPNNRQAIAAYPQNPYHRWAIHAMIDKQQIGWGTTIRIQRVPPIAKRLNHGSWVATQNEAGQQGRQHGIILRDTDLVRLV